MAADDDSSELSSLASLSPVPSDDDLDPPSDLEPVGAKKKGILQYFPKLSEHPPKQASPPPRKREPSPPHEYVLADNPDIAFIVMFRSRFSDAFPKSLAHFGPQELERDVVGQLPGDRVEHFLCALLGLLLNRKQDVKPGHYGRALEDAIATHKSQWAPSWEDKNPLSGGGSFNSMNPTQRLTLLRILILWSMSSSEVIKSLINQAYKQNRHDDDLNQPRSVQPWGSDGDKRRYFLVEGQDDTAFRVYRESNPAGTSRTWWSVAGSIDELKALAEKLEKTDGGPKARKLSQKILQAVPRFEAGEEKRKRRDYRLMRKEQFKRPEPGFSMYEGRTRGKRMKYTYSDDEDAFNSDSTNRRSTRNTGTTTPAETGPVTTSSGRQVRAPPRLNASALSSAPASVQGDASEVEKENSAGPTGRPRRSAAAHYGTNGRDVSVATSSRRMSVDSDEEESQAEFGDDEYDIGRAQEDEEEEEEEDFDEEASVVDEDLDAPPESKIVKLSVKPPKLKNVLEHPNEAANTVTSSLAQDRKTGEEHSPLVEMQDAPGNVSDVHSTDVADGEQGGHAAGSEVVKTANLTFPASERAEEKPSSTTTEPGAKAPLAFRGSPEKAQISSL
ncbi:hypothetical protein S40285_00323 [Stachybotrys chlorohalonatus IBT 40285]|uniref:WHIM1 domain-containing protein n=1 Tax=Stachybotrys chlorohalonatus (strain IBT 40285) TaxID=1283841 RepID=A0A084QHP4_STAC4|nr:hypothetical protein S40285_00323 [Stachybotrys chlorohalonata IBT 40285]